MCELSDSIPSYLNGGQVYTATHVALYVSCNIMSCVNVVVVVVVLLFYVHGKHLRSCRDGQLT